MSLVFSRRTCQCSGTLSRFIAHGGICMQTIKKHFETDEEFIALASSSGENK
jgi:hypothetical protein